MSPCVSGVSCMRRATIIRILTITVYHIPHCRMGRGMRNLLILASAPRPCSLASSQDENKVLKNMPKAKRRALLKKKEDKVDPRKQAAKSQVQMKGRTRSRMRVRV